MTKKHLYATNSILMNRLDRTNAVQVETNGVKNSHKLQDKYVRNVFIQRNNDDGDAVEFDFLDDDCKPKSKIFYNKKGLPVKEIFKSNYGIGDYTAISYFKYDNNDNLVSVRTKVDNDVEYVRTYS